MSYTGKEVAKGLVWAGSGLLSGTWSALRNYGPPIATRAVQLTQDYVAPAVVKAAGVYNQLPAVIKVPVETYTVYQFSPIAAAGLCAVRLAPNSVKDQINPLLARARSKANDVAMRVKQEAPMYWKEGKEAIEHTVQGLPVNAFGTRVAGGGDTGMPQQNLQAVEQDLNVFASRQPLDQQGASSPPRPRAPGPGAAVKPPGINPPGDASANVAATQAIGPRNPIPITDRMVETDQQLQDLSVNLSNFIPLDTMVALGNITDCDPEVIIAMVREAAVPGADGVKPSVKELFLKRYGNRLNWVQKCKIWIFNLFGSSSVFSKTVDEYMKQFLKEMRVRLSTGRWTEKGENTERLIDDLIQFIDVYKCATFAYADATEPTGTLKQYRERAVEKMFGKTLAKTCKECSATLVKHVSPYVKYFDGDGCFSRCANWVLNGGVRLIVNHYLPKGLHTVVLQANAATKPYHLPFVKALTDTVTKQLEKLQSQLDDEPLPPPDPVPGTKHLKDAIASLFYIVEFAHSNTQEAIEEKRQKLKAKRENPGIIDGNIEQEIQDAVLKGTHVLLHHLAVLENSEEMFTNFFALANAPFSRGDIVVQAELDESKEKLDLVIRNVGRRLARDAVKEKFKTARPDGVAAQTATAFQAHPRDARTMSLDLEALSHSMAPKILQLQQGWDPESDILQVLDSMHRVLKAFSNKEQIANDLRGMSEADRSSILLPLEPLYQNIRKQAANLLLLQDQQIQHKNHFQLTQDWPQIDAILAGVAEANPPEFALEHLPSLQAAFDRISKCLPLNAPEIVEMTQKIQAITAALQGANTQKQRLDHLASLDLQIQELRASIEQNSPDRRKHCLIQIRQILQQLPAQDHTRLNPLLRAFNDIKLPSQRVAFDAALNNLRNALQIIQVDFSAARAASIAALPPIDALRAWVQKKRDAYRASQAGNAHLIAKVGADLAQEIEQFKVLVERVKREEQLQLSPRHLGIIGGVGFGVLSLFYPLAAVAIGGAAYAGINQIGPLLKGGKDRATAGGKIGLQAAVGTGVAAGVGMIPIIGPLLVAAGAVVAGGAAGQRAIDGAIDGGQDKVEQSITEFFNKAYEFVALTGAIYQPAAKIAMKQINDAYTTPA